MNFANERNKTSQSRIKRKLADLDKGFTDEDAVMFPDSRSQTRWQLTFNDSAQGNNQQEDERRMWE